MTTPEAEIGNVDFGITESPHSTPSEDVARFLMLCLKNLQALEGVAAIAKSDAYDSIAGRAEWNRLRLVSVPVRWVDNSAIKVTLTDSAEVWSRGRAPSTVTMSLGGFSGMQLGRSIRGRCKKEAHRSAILYPRQSDRSLSARRCQTGRRPH